MGKKKVPWIVKVTKKIKKAPAADISPFLSAVQSKYGQLESQVSGSLEELKSNIESAQATRLANLQNALINAVGSLQYNPYAEKIRTAFSQIWQEKAPPLQQTLTQLKEQQPSIISQFVAANPDVSKALRMAGVYEWAQTRPHKGKSARQVLKYYKQAYQSAEDFLSQTKSFLSDLGFTSPEIEQAMKPYYDLFEWGVHIKE